MPLTVIRIHEKQAVAIQFVAGSPPRASSETASRLSTDVDRCGHANHAGRFPNADARFASTILLAYAFIAASIRLFFGFVPIAVHMRYS